MSLLAESISHSFRLTLSGSIVVVECHHDAAAVRHSRSAEMIAGNLIGNIVPCNIRLVGKQPKQGFALPLSAFDTSVFFDFFLRSDLPFGQWFGRASNGNRAEQYGRNCNDQLHGNTPVSNAQRVAAALTVMQSVLRDMVSGRQAVLA